MWCLYHIGRIGMFRLLYTFVAAHGTAGLLDLFFYSVCILPSWPLGWRLSLSLVFCLANHRAPKQMQRFWGLIVFGLRCEVVCVVILVPSHLPTSHEQWFRSTLGFSNGAAHASHANGLWIDLCNKLYIILWHMQQICKIYISILALTWRLLVRSWIWLLDL